MNVWKKGPKLVPNLLILSLSFEGILSDTLPMLKWVPPNTYCTRRQNDVTFSVFSGSTMFSTISQPSNSINFDACHLVSLLAQQFFPPLFTLIFRWATRETVKLVHCCRSSLMSTTLQAELTTTTSPSQFTTHRSTLWIPEVSNYENDSPIHHTFVA